MSAELGAVAQFDDAVAPSNDAFAQSRGKPAAPRLVGRDIVCFANDWSGDPLSKKHVMTRLAQNNRVLWVNSLGNRAPRASARDLRRIADKLGRFVAELGARPAEVAPNIHVITPLAIPNYRARWAHQLNRLVVGATVRAAMRSLGFRDPLLYTFVPASAWIAGRLGETHVVYHCVDEYSQFDGAGAEIAALEADLIHASDLVITCSTRLQQSKQRLHPNTRLVRHGVEQAHFARALDPELELPADVRDLPGPRFGFYGLVAEWVDLESMARIAERWPHGSVVIIGEHNNANRAGMERLRALPNVHFLGRKPYAELPAYCKAFDVALLPFVKNELTDNANPLKLREYLAAGLPVVSTDIPEAAALGDHGVYLADGPDAFVAAAAQALAAGAGPDPARSAVMARESWDAKVADIETLLLELNP
jgi:glycosyltransferase involved in cell wall biosynthesis